MTESPGRGLRLRDALLRDTNAEKQEEPAPEKARVTQLSAAHAEAGSRDFLTSIPFYEGQAPFDGLPTNLVMERIWGKPDE